MSVAEGSARRRPGRLDDRPRDRGMGLAELVVTMGLMALVGVLVSGVAVVVLRHYTEVQARLENTTQAELGIAAAGKVIRTAIRPEQIDDLSNRDCSTCSNRAILRATRTRLQFYANVGDTTVGPALVTLDVCEDPTRRGTARLVQDTRPARSLGGGTYTHDAPPSDATRCASPRRVLARGLLWPSPGVFAYYDFDGDPIAAATLGSADLPRVSSIDLVVTARLRPGDPDAPGRTAVSRVRLPNVETAIPSETT